MVVVECFGHAVQVRGGRQDDKDVEYLMRTAPDVESAGCGPLRPANLGSISHCPRRNETTVKLTA